jgi:hypothetical protein
MSLILNRCGPFRDRLSRPNKGFAAILLDFQIEALILTLDSNGSPNLTVFHGKASVAIAVLAAVQVRIPKRGVLILHHIKKGLPIL